MIRVLSALLLFIVTMTAHAGYVYQSGSNNPWGNTTNDTAMDGAFGAGQWSRGNAYDLTAILASDAAFIDGSDSNANELNSFLQLNRASLENYVTNGGRLFINSAPNEGSSFSLLFGATLNYDGSSFSDTATVNADGSAAGLLAGGITDQYTGTWFSHASVTGNSLISLIDGQNGSILSYMLYGQGLVMFGGQTTTNFHSPLLDAERLLQNELTFLANGQVSQVPVPAAVWLFGSALMGLGGVSRRNKLQRNMAV
jgi:hypothetical protein